MSWLPPLYRIVQMTNDNATWYIVQERLLWFWYVNAITYRHLTDRGVEIRPKEYHTADAAQRCLCNEIASRKRRIDDAVLRASSRTVAGHQEADREREEAEKGEAKTELIRTRALAKLTPAERAALGV